jgi:hypothetical protein
MTASKGSTSGEYHERETECAGSCRVWRVAYTADELMLN